MGWAGCVWCVRIVGSGGLVVACDVLGAHAFEFIGGEVAEQVPAQVEGLGDGAAGALLSDVLGFEAAGEREVAAVLGG